jgi:hypothetical protein
VLDEAADVLAIDVDGAAATRSGSSLCGPASGTAGFADDYQMSPSELAIIPRLVRPRPAKEGAAGWRPPLM